MASGTWGHRYTDHCRFGFLPFSRVIDQFSMGTLGSNDCVPCGSCQKLLEIAPLPEHGKGNDVSIMSTMHTNSRDIVEMTTRILVQLQQEPGRGSSEWPSVTMQQLRVMMILYADGPTRVSVLARKLNVSTPTVTGILDRLVKQELTYRADDPRDRRVVLNALTDHGRHVIEHLQPLDSDRLHRAISSLSDDERSDVMQALSRLVDAVESTTNTVD